MEKRYIWVGLLAVAVQAEKALEYREISGKRKAVYSEGTWSDLKKYHKDDYGNHIELGTSLIQDRDREMAEFGVFSTRLKRKLDEIGDQEKVRVLITFPVSDRPYRLSRAEGEGRNVEALQKGKRALKAKFNFEVPDVPQLDGRTVEISVTKKDLSRLKHDPSVASIELAEFDPAEKGGPSATLHQVFSQNTTGLNASAFTDPGYAGQHVRIGAVEWDAIQPTDIPLWFSFGNPILRTGTPANAANSHATYVLATIRNAYGSPTYEYFLRGGAFSLQRLGYATRHSNEGNYFNAYEWAISSTHITNSSWRYHRWVNTASAQAQNAHDRLWDIRAADYPYMLNVVAAGNEGSAQPAAWWGHNHIVVGSINSSGSVSSFSSHRNGSTDDEVPHVVAIGESIQYPNGSFHSGTSFAAPAITALVADFYDKWIGYSSAPEVTKAIVLASAIGRPVDGESYSSWKDTKGGFGIPDGAMIDAIGSNGYLNPNPPPSIHGCIMKAFKAAQGAGAEISIPITSTAPAGSYVHFLTTWYSNPEGTCSSGAVCRADDVDLSVFNVSSGAMIASSTSGKNTTERVQFLKTESGPVAYTVKLKLYSRITNKDVYIGTAWTMSPTAINVP